MKRPFLAPAALVALVLVSATATAYAEQRVGAHGLALPATFSGILPCADCPGIRHHLDLWPDGMGFTLRREYIDRDTVLDEIGRWHVDPARNALVLRGSGGEVQEWQILANQQLRLLDKDGAPIESELNYALESGPLTPTELSLPLTGMFTYFADAAIFTECLSGQTFPVAMEEDYLAAETAYLDARIAPAAPLLMRLEGSIAEREQMEGPPRRTLTIDRVHHVTPHGGCPSDRAAPDLTNTYWRIARLNGDPFPDVDGRREAHLLLLETDGTRYSATVGCNTLIGGAEQDGDALSFGTGASTLMACPDGLDQLETALGAALAATARFDIDGQALHLRDADGVETARFRAAYTRY